MDNVNIIKKQLFTIPGRLGLFIMLLVALLRVASPAAARDALLAASIQNPNSYDYLAALAASNGVEIGRW